MKIVCNPETDWSSGPECWFISVPTCSPDYVYTPRMLEAITATIEEKIGYAHRDLLPDGSIR